MSKENITATLEGWYQDAGYGPNIILRGEIHGDVHNRWVDGTYIRTSKVILGELEEGSIVTTLNNTYKLGKSLQSVLNEGKVLDANSTPRLD